MQLRYFSIKIVAMAIAFLCISYRLAAPPSFESATALFNKVKDNPNVQSAVTQGTGLLNPTEAAATPKADVLEVIESENDVEDETPPVEVITPTTKEPTALESAQLALEAAQELKEAKGLYKKAQEVMAPTRTAAEKESARLVEEQKINSKIRAKEKAKNPSWLKYLNK
jgi:hypothetical protein